MPSVLENNSFAKKLLCMKYLTSWFRIRTAKYAPNGCQKLHSLSIFVPEKSSFGNWYSSTTSSACLSSIEIVSSKSKANVVVVVVVVGSWKSVHPSFGEGRQRSPSTRAKARAAAFVLLGGSGSATLLLLQ